MFSLNRFCIFETTIILLLGYFSESCKFISILFVLCNQFSILTFVALFIDLMQDDALTLSRCSCIGPRAMVLGEIVQFCQIHLVLENSVEMPYYSHC